MISQHFQHPDRTAQDRRAWAAAKRLDARGPEYRPGLKRGGQGERPLRGPLFLRRELAPVTSWLYIMKYKPFITDLRATTTVSPAKITGFHQQTSAKLKKFGCADFSAEDVRQKMVFWLGTGWRDAHGECSMWIPTTSSMVLLNRGLLSSRLSAK